MIVTHSWTHTLAVILETATPCQTRALNLNQTTALVSNPRHSLIRLEMAWESAARGGFENLPAMSFSVGLYFSRCLLKAFVMCSGFAIEITFLSKDLM
jgi:hypothetical protein